MTIENLKSIIINRLRRTQEVLSQTTDDFTKDYFIGKETAYDDILKLIEWSEKQ